jgi:hypothetical protein
MCISSLVFCVISALAVASYYQPDTYQQYLAAQVRCLVPYCSEIVSCCHVHERPPVLCELGTGCRVLLVA